jgi:CRISPR-associated endonuclease Cas2
MLVMLAYDVPETKHQNLLRKEFEALGGVRVQYSIYVFEGEDHECERIIRYMRRVVQTSIPHGDVRLMPMERSVWEQQILLLNDSPPVEKRMLAEFVLVWE